MTLGVVFPGQGSQRVGMLEEAAGAFSVVRETFSEASDALGYDMWALVSQDPDARLSLTEFTQPAILTASVALFRAFESCHSIAPVAAAGHSLGEYSALVSARALSLYDGVRLVRKRGAAMQKAVPVGEGAMAVILGLTDDVVSSVCDALCDATHYVGGVNFNAPGQVVIAGQTKAVENAMLALKEAGARRAMSLPVSAPFHTPLMQPAADIMASAFDEVVWSEPDFPVVSNVDGSLQRDPADIKQSLVKQISSPVMWTECVATLGRVGCEMFIESGPGNVLSGLSKRIDKSVPIKSIESVTSIEAGLSDL
ncbi:MAG: ACP S-malonyltransferase [Halieaceae bacterium]|jgi:[acyl-carrier-protein] S-malonyltransferase|nr:ACP S-malonyltransferase [Halieaceae bacterium]MBT6182252.1 ACP S-malonyltransferase [Halieaceae bacterium]